MFVAVALVFFGIAIVSAWHDTHGQLPSIARLAGAALFVGIGLAAAAVSWVTLLGGKHRLDNAAALLMSQLARYVPGAIWQAAGLVSLARSVGVRVGRSVTAFTVMALTQAVAGCTFAVALAITWTSISPASARPARHRRHRRARAPRSSLDGRVAPRDPRTERVARRRTRPRCGHPLVPGQHRHPRDDERRRISYCSGASVRFTTRRS